MYDDARLHAAPQDGAAGVFRTTADSVESWRREQFEAAGLDPARSRYYAAARKPVVDVGDPIPYLVDLGAFRRLVDVGATADQAVRILA